MSDRKWIVMDLDGTLCDCSHRVHWAQAKQWDRFHEGIMDDKPHPEAVEFLKILEAANENWDAGYEVLVCTGRNDTHRFTTEKWLIKNDLADKISRMLMRPDGDWSPDHILKPKLVSEYFGSMDEARNRVLLILEDRDRVVEAWRNLGFSCWQVNVGEY